MWASAESPEYILGYYRRASAHADRTIETLHLDTIGWVPWWNEGERETTLGAILTLMIAETARHVGHVDIVRELIDGTAGGSRNATGLPNADDQRWRDYVTRLESLARTTATRRP